MVKSLPSSYPSSATQAPAALPQPLGPGDRITFPLSPLIRLTLLLLYLALLGPLPFLAQVTQSAVSPALLTTGILLGFGVLYGALGQRVELDNEAIAVTYPRWIRWLFRGGWRLPWPQARALKPRSTGQGGLVYYFVGPEVGAGGSSDPASISELVQQRAYLLPMRVAGFARLVGFVEVHTGIDTRDIKSLAQPWMYLLLLGLTLLLLLVDGFTIAAALAMA
jgi:hypothetical protein